MKIAAVIGAILVLLGGAAKASIVIPPVVVRGGDISTNTSQSSGGSQGAPLSAQLPVSVNQFTSVAAAVSSGQPLYFPAGTWTYSGGTIAQSITLAPGAILSCTGGTTISGALNAGRYQIFSSGCVPYLGGAKVPFGVPEWWGAVADYAGGGTGTGTDNNAALNAAIASGVSELRIVGSYRFTGTLTINRGNFVFFGVSPDAAALYQDDAAGTHDAILAQQEGITIEGIFLTPLQTHTAGAGIRAKDTTYLHIQNNNVSGFWNNIELDGVSTGANQLYLIRNQIESAANDNIYLYAPTSGVTLSDIYITGANYIRDAGHAGIEGSGYAGAYVTGNVIYHNGYGIYAATQVPWKVQGQNDIDTNTSGNYFGPGTSNSYFSQNWLGSDGPTTFNGPTNIVMGGNQFNGISTLVLNGVVGLVSSGDLFTGMNTPVTISNYSSTSPSNISLTGEEWNNGTGAFVTFTGSPAASYISIGVNLNSSLGETVSTGTVSYLNVVGASEQNNINNATSRAGCGTNNTTANAMDMVCGYANYTGGYGSRAFGAYNNVTGQYSSADGQQVTDFGRFACNSIGGGNWGSGTYDNTAAQRTECVMRAATSSTTATRLTTDGAAPGSANCFNLPASSTATVEYTFTGQDTTTGGNAASVTGGAGILYRNGSGNATWASSSTGTANGVGTGATTKPTIAADVTNECLSVSITAPNNDNWHWELWLRATENVL